MHFIPQYPPNSYRMSRQIPKSGEGCPIKPTIWLLAEVPPSWAVALSMDVPLPWGWRFGNGIKGMPWDAVPSDSRWIWLNMINMMPIWVWPKKRVWIVPRVIQTYGTRSCQQAFWSGPCHKGLHGYEYKYKILSRYKYKHRKNTDIYNRNSCFCSWFVLVSVLGLYLFLCSLAARFCFVWIKVTPPSHRYSSETKPIHAQDLQLLRYGSWVWIIGMDRVL